MAITRKEVDPGSSVAMPVNPWQVRVPRSNPIGIADVTVAAVPQQIVMSGPYCVNISSDTFSCDLIMPMHIVATTINNTDTFRMFIRGRDQFGKAVSETYTKVNANRQTGPASKWAYSHIDEMRVVATLIGTASETTIVGDRLRIGHLLARYAVGASDFSNRVTSGNDTLARIPLPYRAQGTGDITVRFSPDYLGQLITSAPVASNTTFDATHATTAGTWDTATPGVTAGDIAYTRDGYIGVIISATSGAGAALTVGSWFKASTGAGGNTPANVTGSANNQLAVTVYRPPFLTQYVAGTGGFLPGMVVVAADPASGNETSGVNTQFSTFGFQGYCLQEPMVDTVWEIISRVGTLV